MRVAGIGFRAAASEDSLHDALNRALAQTVTEQDETPTLDAVYTEAAKARTPVFRAFAQSLGVPGLGIAAPDLAQMLTPTQSARIQDRFGTGSLAEAAALAGAGAGAVLVAERVVSGDAMATAALAHVPDIGDTETQVPATETGETTQ